MGEYYVLDKDKKTVPVDNVLEWARMFEDSKSRRVAKTDLTDGVYVSTVFLGMDHSWGDGPPLLFETMVFEGDMDQEQDRCSTWDEAVEMHKNMVKRVKGETDGKP